MYAIRSYYDPDLLRRRPAEAAARGGGVGGAGRDASGAGARQALVILFVGISALGA